MRLKGNIPYYFTITNKERERKREMWFLRGVII